MRKVMQQKSNYFRRFLVFVSLVMVAVAVCAGKPGKRLKPIELHPGDIVFVNITPKQIKRMKREHGEDAYVIFDDMNYYSYEASVFLDSISRKSKHVEGDRQLVFCHDGVREPIKYDAESAGSIVVLCATDAYKVVSTIDFESEYNAFMGDKSLKR